VLGREPCGEVHDVSILMAPGDQVRGVSPRANISTGVTLTFESRKN
jgi:hypothetical protein